MGALCNRSHKPPLMSFFTKSIVPTVGLVEHIKPEVKLAIEKVANISGGEELEIARIPPGKIDEIANYIMWNDVIAITNKRIIRILDSRCEDCKYSDIRSVIYTNNKHALDYKITIYLKDTREITFYTPYKNSAEYLVRIVGDKMAFCK